MYVKRLLRVTNGRVRLLVGLFIAALLCIQCTQRMEATRALPAATAISPGQLPHDQRLTRIENLARTDHAALLEECLKNCQANYRDYTCTFYKQERISGKLGKEQEIQVKHMDEPFSVAMAWTANIPIADRALYVEGRWNNQMMVRPARWPLSLAGPQLRYPDDAEAMKNTLRPISKFGFERSLQSLIEVYKLAADAGDLKQSLGYADESGKAVEYVQIDGRNAIVLARYLPAKDGYPAARTLIYVDLEYLVPVCVEATDWDGKMLSRYLFKSIKFNTGLREDDFLPEANGMKQ